MEGKDGSTTETLNIFKLKPAWLLKRVFRRLMKRS
jgi:hypothetical protein